MTLRFLPADLPPIEGVIRTEPEDFLVDEVLAYAPSGSGTHSYLRIEKTGLSTFEAVRRLARELGRRESDFGYAGLKDRNARTRQTLSLEFADQAALARLAIPGLTLLDVARHGNKLKLGHLRGNRFEIRVRGARPGDDVLAATSLARLAERGVPNRFGAQRFGRGNATPRLGRLLLASDLEGFLRALAVATGRIDEAAAAAALPGELCERCQGGDASYLRALRAWAERGRPADGTRVLAKGFLSLCTAAVQSEVFNTVLDRRLPEIDGVRAGDVAFLHRNGACFLVEDVAREAPRALAFEISPSGPLPGPKCLRPQGEIGDLEAAVLAAHGVTHELFDCRGVWSQPGARRPLRVPLGAPTARAEPAAGGEAIDVVLSFELPAGSFATAVLGEVVQGVADSLA